MEQNEKKAFRKQMLAKRDAIPPENRRNADNARNEIIRTWNVYKNAELILFYVSYRSEANTLDLLKEALQEGRNVAVPKVVENEMVFYRIMDFSQLVEGYRGILEPDTEKTVPITEVTSALLFVPGCAFDKNGGRMGYGGGFYDRFMERYPEVKRVALCYEEQLVEKVPRERHDKRVDVIITEVQIRKASKNAKNKNKQTGKT